MTAFGLVLAEPDVALTDWALSVEAFALAGFARSYGRAWTAFFASIGVAALLGGVSHGVVPQGNGVAGTVLWRATVLALGATSWAAVVAASRALAPAAGAYVRAAAAALALGYAGIVLAVTDRFVVAVIAYLPATVFLLGVFLVAARRAGGGSPLIAACGLVVLLVGSWAQWRAIDAPLLGLSHNALFHVIQMLALPLIYQGVGIGRAREA